MPSVAYRLEVGVEFSILDFFTGFALMNAMPHFIFGIARIRFISAFGYSPAGNLSYALLNFALALVLFHVRHGLASILDHGIALGALFILVSYFVTGKMFYARFSKPRHAT